MALDSARKRASVASLGLAFLGASVVPDGSFAVGDRQTIANSYYGIDSTTSGIDVGGGTATLEAYDSSGAITLEINAGGGTATLSAYSSSGTVSLEINAGGGTAQLGNYGSSGQVSVGTAVVVKPRSSGGRYFSWTPEPEKPDRVLKYRKTALDDELERLLREAIQREDLSKQAQKIADRLAKDVTAVSDIRRAARHVGEEVVNLQQKHKIKQKEATKRLDKLKEEEDLILSLILMEL